MLRLEKNSQKQSITLTMRQQEPFFDRSLIIALFTASSLHLIGFLLFHIQVISFEKTLTPLDPVTIDIDLGHSNQGGVLAKAGRLESEGLILHGFTVAPIPSFPQMQFCCTTSPDKQFDSLMKFWGPKDLFPLAEVHCPNEPCPFVFDASCTSIKIQIKGPLANHILQEDTSTFQEMIPSSIVGEHLLCFKVRVEDYIGHIFWFDREGPPPSKELELAAETILKRIRFVPKCKKELRTTTTGYIEFHFNFIEDL